MVEPSLGILIGDHSFLLTLSSIRRESCYIQSTKRYGERGPIASSLSKARNEGVYCHST